MTSIYFTLFDFVAAAAFMAMWLEDKQRKYLLAWAAAHFFIPFLIYSAVKLNTLVSPEFGLYPVLYSVACSGLIVTIIVGAMYFRGLPVNARMATFAAGLIALSNLILVSGLPYLMASNFVAVLLFLSYLIVAKLLWLAHLSERATSVFFVFRALCIAALFFLQDVLTHQMYGQLLSIATAVSAILNVVLLLIISFHKTTDELKRNLQFFNVLHLITAGIRAVKNEQELGEKVLAEALALPFWSSGALMRVSADRQYLKLIATKGNEKAFKDYVDINRIELTGALSEKVIETGEPMIIRDDSLKKLSLNSGLKNLQSQNLLGNSIYLLIPVSNQGVQIGVLILSDLSDRKPFPQEVKTLISIGEIIGSGIENLEHVKKLNYRAGHDSLTGLNNRLTLHDYCQRELANERYILMLFDLDGFKEVNDVFGHGTGDKLLQGLAKNLEKSLAGVGMLYRLGGDEFVVVYPQKTVQSRTDVLAQSLLEMIKTPLVIGDLKFECLASIGVVDTKTVGNDSHELLRCADLAMYKAKHSEQGIAYYDKAYDLYMRERIELMGDVTTGLNNHEFELFYQPIINTKDNSCHLCEGLLRWHHPKRGLLNADDFIPIVELTEQISHLTYRVIELAIQDIATWRQQKIDINIAINLSARNFLDPNLPDFLINTAGKYGVLPQCLVLEITETVLMKDPDVAESITHRLIDAGFKIALDDFGTGYSSLSYLARFPINFVKIDRSFVDQMVVNERNKNIVEATIELTHKLGFTVIAEGVEKKQTEESLKSLNCDYAQGFFYCEPVNKDQFIRWYQQHTNS